MTNTHIVIKNQYEEQVRKAKADAYQNYLNAENNYMFCADDMFDIYLKYENLDYKFGYCSENGVVKLTSSEYKLLQNIIGK